MITCQLRYAVDAYEQKHEETRCVLCYERNFLRRALKRGGQ